MNFFFFYGAENPCSNWHLADIIVKDKTFNSVEMFLMFSKAMLFGDTETAEEIMKATYQGDQKALGRKVRNYNEDVWAAKRESICAIGALEKFTQHPDLGKWLLSLGDVYFVEASPSDRIWGCGFSTRDSRIHRPELWPGQNLCGRAIDRVARTLRERAASEKTP